VIVFLKPVLLHSASVATVHVPSRSIILFWIGMFGHWFFLCGLEKQATSTKFDSPRPSVDFRIVDEGPLGRRYCIVFDGRVKLFFYGN